MKYILQIIIFVSIGLSQLDVSVYTDKEQYSYNEPVEIFVSGYNTTGDTLFLEWGSALQWNYSIDGQWQLDGAAIFSYLTILPDSIHVWHWTHDYPIDPGYHEIVGVVDNYGLLPNTTYITINGLGVETVSENPIKFSFLNSYPNPFNPITKIDFVIPENDNYELSIYNIRGELMETLFKSYQESGKYSFIWYANDKPSGIYIIILESESLYETKKILLVK